jgi:hypothetical protein
MNAALMEQLANFKVAKRVYLVAMGKVRNNVLRDRFQTK